MKIGVTYHPQKKLVATTFAVQNQLALVEQQSTDYDYLLVFTEQRLELIAPQVKNFRPFYIDFASARLAYRTQHISVRNELIAKAVGIKANYRPSIIDATAGLGRDAFILARLGCDVLMLERCAIMAALLQDGLIRLCQASPPLQLNVCHIDAVDYLAALPPEKYPDVIYLDPMYPVRSKSALVKKELRILRDLVGDDLDAEKLLQLAIRKARKRVVLKRPRHAIKCNLLKSNFSFNGKDSRFDVFLIKQP